MGEIKDNVTILQDLIAAGLPAFPSNVALNDGATFNAPGMMLRDYAAIQVLAAMAQSAGFQGAPWKNLAKDAYEAADAIVAERVHTPAAQRASKEGRPALALSSKDETNG